MPISRDDYAFPHSYPSHPDAMAMFARVKADLSTCRTKLEAATAAWDALPEREKRGTVGMEAGVALDLLRADEQQLGFAYMDVQRTVLDAWERHNQKPDPYRR